ESQQQNPKTLAFFAGVPRSSQPGFKKTVLCFGPVGCSLTTDTAPWGVWRNPVVQQRPGFAFASKAARARVRRPNARGCSGFRQSSPSDAYAPIIDPSVNVTLGIYGKPRE